MLLLYLHRHTVNCYHFNISKIIFLTLSDARMCVPVYIYRFFSFFLFFFLLFFFFFSLARSSTGVAWEKQRVLFSFNLCSLNRKAAAFHVRLGIQGLSFNRPRFAHSLDLFLFFFLFSFFFSFFFFLSKVSTKQINYLIDKQREREGEREKTRV